MRFHHILVKQIMKVSAFYLEKQKSFIPKKIFFRPLAVNMPREIQKMALAVLIFSEGFGNNYLVFRSNATSLRKAWICSGLGFRTFKVLTATGPYQ